MPYSFGKIDEVQHLIQLYIDGSNGDTAKLKEAYHPRAYIMGHGEMLGFKEHFPAENLIKIMEDNPHFAGPNYTVTVRSVDLTNEVGTVVLVETDFHSCDFVTYLSVAKLEGKWFITNKTYTCTGKSGVHSQ